LVRARGCWKSRTYNLSHEAIVWNIPEGDWQRVRGAQRGAYDFDQREIVLGGDPPDLRRHGLRARLLAGWHCLLASSAKRVNNAIRADHRRLWNVTGSQHVTWCDQIPAATAFSILQNFDDAAGFH
jgi:hypothetical protein